MQPSGETPAGCRNRKPGTGPGLGILCPSRGQRVLPGPSPLPGRLPVPRKDRHWRWSWTVLPFRQSLLSGAIRRAIITCSCFAGRWSLWPGAHSAHPAKALSCFQAAG